MENFLMYKIKLYLLAITMTLSAFSTGVLASDDTIELKDKEWKFTLAPLYVWWLTMDGSTSISNPDSGDHNIFPLDGGDLTGAFSVHLEAKQDKWTFFTDYLNAEYTTNASFGPSERLKGENQLRIKLFEVGQSYRVVEKSRFDIEVLGGLRYLEADNKLTFDRIGPFKADANVLDGFAGGRFIGRVTDSITARARGDIGTGQSKFIWNVMIGMDWRYKDWGSVYAGYRWLDYEFEKEKTGDDLRINLEAKGPVVGLIFNW